MGDGKVALDHLLREANKYASGSMSLRYALRVVETAFLLDHEPEKILAEVRDFASRTIPDEHPHYAIAVNAYYISAHTNETPINAYMQIKDLASKKGLELDLAAESLINAHQLLGTILRDKRNI